MPNYIAYYIDNDDRKIKLMESYSNEKLAWSRVGQVLFLDYSYLDIIIDELQTSDESKILTILLQKIDGFEKFWKEYGKKFKVGHFSALFLRKMIECIELLKYISDDDPEDIFGVWIQK